MSQYFILAAAVLVALPIFLFLWRRRRIAKAAQGIVRRVDSAFQANHVFRKVQAQDYPWLTERFYTQARQEAEAAGFAWLADIEDETLSATYPNLRTFVRILLGPDHRTRAAVYEIVPGGPQGKPTRAPVQTRELISEASDGATLTTTTAQTSNLLNPPPGTVRRHVSADTPLKAMLATHRQAIDDYLSAHPGVFLKEIRSFEQATAAWQKSIDRQREKLQAQGGLGQDEMVRFGGKDREKLAVEVHEQMRKIKKDQ